MEALLPFMSQLSSPSLVAQVLVLRARLSRMEQ